MLAGQESFEDFAIVLAMARNTGRCSGTGAMKSSRICLGVFIGKLPATDAQWHIVYFTAQDPEGKCSKGNSPLNTCSRVWHQ